MNEKNEMHREFVGKLKVLDTTNPKVYRVRIKALNSEVNRNGWRYVELQRHLEEFRDIPILTAYVGGGAIVGDGHNYNMRRDPKTGEEYPSFTAPDAERIVGWVPKDADIRIENEDGVDWVVLDAGIWRWYSRELVDKIARQGSADVSIETLVFDEYMDGDVAVETSYSVLGITILGNGVSPAVAGAKIQTLAELSELRNNMAEAVLKAASFIGEEAEPEPAGVEDPEIEPTKKSNKGESTSMNYFSRKQLAELEPKFPDMKVLAAASDEQGIHVCLMAADGATSVYTMESDGATIAPEKFQKVNAQAVFNFGAECDMSVDLCDLWDTMSANVIRFQSEADKASKALEEANATIKAMQDAENKRRISAAKEMARNTLDKQNANREEKYSDEFLSAINADIEAGMYTERMNSENEWIGAAEVETRVLAECARQQAAIDEKLAKSKESTFILDKFNASKGKEPEGIGGLLSRMGKK